MYPRYSFCLRLQLIDKIAEVIQRVNTESFHRGKRLGGILHIKNRVLLLAGVAPVSPALSANAVVGVKNAHEVGRLFFLGKQCGQLFLDADKPSFQRSNQVLIDLTVALWALISLL